MFICTPPSPEITITGLSGFPILAPIPPGSPYPMVPSPPDIIICFPSVTSAYWETSIWCCPTSVTIMLFSNWLLISFRISIGLNTSFGRITSGCSCFHFLIWSSHFPVEHSCTYSFIFVMASFASATIGMSTWMFREMDAVSISICIICACGANSWSFPVIRSLNRVPMEKSTSQLLTAIFAA